MTICNGKCIHKQTFDLNVRFSADYVRFSLKSGRIDTVTVESARDPLRKSKSDKYRCHPSVRNIGCTNIRTNIQIRTAHPQTGKKI